MNEENFGDELIEILGDPDPEGGALDGRDPENDDDIRLAGEETKIRETDTVSGAMTVPDTLSETEPEDDTMIEDGPVEAASIREGGTEAESMTGSTAGAEAITGSTAEAEVVTEGGAEPEDVTESTEETDNITESTAEAEEITGGGTEPELSAEEEFAEELDFVEHEQQDQAILAEIGDSIINQVETELIEPAEKVQSVPDEPAGEKDIKALILSFLSGIPRWGYVAIGCAAFVVIVLMWLLMSKTGQGVLIRIGSRYIAEKVSYEPVGEIDEVQGDETDDLAYGETKDPVVDFPDDFEVITPEPLEEPAEDENTPRNVYNILLLGEENIDSGGSRGRTDLIMIASINISQKKLKLTSVLRDSLVSIPDHSDNRINAAYTIGGVSLMYDTFKKNLGIDFDNYILVNFESFENIINVIGGIDVDLTEEEASYLNRTNYISKEQYRNVVPGANHLNGNQALGYCRIRKVETKDHLYSDMGRTARQRRLVKSIFSSIEKMNYVDKAAFANKCLGYVRTDLTSEEIETYLTVLSDIGSLKAEECRIPVEGSYYDVRLRGMLVTNIDLKTNAQALRTFIYGE